MVRPVDRQQRYASRLEYPGDLSKPGFLHSLGQMRHHGNAVQQVHRGGLNTWNWRHRFVDQETPDIAKMPTASGDGLGIDVNADESSAGRHPADHVPQHPTTTAAPVQHGHAGFSYGMEGAHVGHEVVSNLPTDP